MYLHIGKNYIVNEKNVICILNIETLKWEFYKDFLAINGNPAQISIGQELKVPFINNVTKSDEPVDGITIVDCPESTETESVEENKKPGFFARIWSGIKSFFKGIGNFFKKLFGIDKDKYETITVCSEEQSPFQKLMQEGKIEKDGEFHTRPVMLSNINNVKNGAYNARDVQELGKLHVDYCFNCGSCTFVCPAKRPCTQMMSLAKAYYLDEIKKGGNK